MVLQLSSVSELFGSDYGWLIVGKVFFLVLLLVLAFLNRFRWLPKKTAPSSCSTASATSAPAACNS